jgi:hypothetical protein
MSSLKLSLAQTSDSDTAAPLSETELSERQLSLSDRPPESN